MKIRLGTRGSRLAVVQSEAVAAALRARGAEVEIVVIRTSGDRLAQVALADFGGKALFVKEIEEALLAGQVDVGVHSLKDMPSELPAALTLGAFPLREDPCDVLLGRRDGGWDALPAGAVVGTSSPRRRAMVLARRPDLRTEPIRGNVDTRLEKLRGRRLRRAHHGRGGAQAPGARARRTPRRSIRPSSCPRWGRGCWPSKPAKPTGNCLNFCAPWTTLGRGSRPWPSGHSWPGWGRDATRRWPLTRAWTARPWR